MTTTVFLSSSSNLPYLPFISCFSHGCRTIPFTLCQIPLRNTDTMPNFTKLALVLAGGKLRQTVHSQQQD